MEIVRCIYFFLAGSFLWLGLYGRIFGSPFLFVDLGLSFEVMHLRGAFVALL